MLPESKIKSDQMTSSEQIASKASDSSSQSDQSNQSNQSLPSSQPVNSKPSESPESSESSGSPESPVLPVNPPSLDQIKFLNKVDKMEFILNGSEQQLFMALKKVEDQYVKLQQELAQVTNQRIALRAQLSVVQQLKAKLAEPLKND